MERSTSRATALAKRSCFQSDDHMQVSAKPVRVLVTGFGRFPGARANPTTLLIRALAKHKSRLALIGVQVELHVLPVVYAAVAPRLRELAEGLAPDIILHFGLAARRKTLCVETRALNRVSLVHPDAARATAGRRSIVPGAAFAARATFPSSLIAAALRRAGIKGRLSIDAGDYICNQTFYLSLATTSARSIGFIHLPRFARRHWPKSRCKEAATDPRPTLDDAIRAALIAIRVMTAKLGGARRSEPRVEALSNDADAPLRHNDATKNSKRFHVHDEPEEPPIIGRARA
jgi:pyroglutamyl-peptidase